jgi:hypothetical protein
MATMAGDNHPEFSINPENEAEFTALFEEIQRTIADWFERGIRNLMNGGPTTKFGFV